MEFISLKMESLRSLSTTFLNKTTSPTKQLPNIDDKKLDKSKQSDLNKINELRVAILGQYQMFGQDECINQLQEIKVPT